MELSSFSIKKFLILSTISGKRKKLLIFQKMLLLSPNSKKSTLKKLSSRKWNFLATKNLMKLFKSSWSRKINKTPLPEIRCLSNLLAAQASNVLIYFCDFVILWSCDFRGTMSCQRSPHSSHFLWLMGHLPRQTSLLSSLILPAQSIPRGAEGFPRGEKYLNVVPFLTQLIYFPPKGITS